MENNVRGQTDPRWLLWAREMQALAQTGLALTRDPYDRERYQRLRGLAARIMTEHRGQDVQPIEALFAGDIGYATPKLDVRGAVFRDSRLLLVRETADGDRWTLPGGWADVNESPFESVVKEVREESGFDVRVAKLAAVWDRARHPHVPSYTFHIWKLFFVCEIIGGAARGGLETSAVEFFAEDELPRDLSISRVLLPQLRRMFEHMRRPELPTDFDLAA
ncbi:MAG: NUDIX hydrolase [Acetobacteraceae bacterium]|jgi:ADP-ribose pyrophosphatase YjhB (NUDIX family)